MGIGIDWVAAGILLVAFVVSQIRSVPPSVRYGVIALACGAIAGYRLRMGATGLNLGFVILAAALAVYYLFRAFSTRRR
jgi:uncharacterized membrane protein HdeD (DUF308 family)